MVREIGDRDAYALVIYDVPLLPPVIHQVWVDPKYRGQGHGRRLLEAAIDFARGYGDEVLIAPVPDMDCPIDVFVWQANHNMMALAL